MILVLEKDRNNNIWESKDYTIFYNCCAIVRKNEKKKKPTYL